MIVRLASRPFKRTKGGAADIINNNNRLAYISGRAPSTQHGHGMHTVACKLYVCFNLETQCRKSYP